MTVRTILLELTKRENLATVPCNALVTAIARQGTVPAVQGKRRNAVVEAGQDERIVCMTPQTLGVVFASAGDGSTRAVNIGMTCNACVGYGSIAHGPTGSGREGALIELVALAAFERRVLAEKLVTGISIVLKL